MTTTNEPVDGGPTLIASGPINATISFEQGVGQWFLHDSAPGPDLKGHYLGQRPESMSIPAGRNLYIEGQGNLVLVLTPVS